jgi:DNA processing protein
LATPSDLACLRLALIPGLGPITYLNLVQRFGTPEGVLAASPGDVAQFAGIAMAQALAWGPDQRLVERSIAWMDLPGHHVLTAESTAYPEMLRQIPDPPIVLYAIGRVELLQRPCLAIVGSRNCTPQGARDARSFARELSKAGLCIVSGLALGVDAAAHRGGLEEGASSIAVMGTGADICYPRSHHDLARQLAERGCIITEFPLGTRPLRGNFPRRNRLISGLARGVLVVEAAEDSGSLLTAQLALDQNREVLAMPGPVHSTLTKGCHKLIRDGATLVECARDVLVELRLASPARASPAACAPPPASDPVLHAIGFECVSPDQIAQRTGLAVAAIAARLSRLEIDGEIEAVAGGRFQRVERAR